MEDTESNATLFPVEMIGWSMAPWLCPEDILLVHPIDSQHNIRLGDVLLMVRHDSQEVMVHRAMGRRWQGSWRSKGDRNMAYDEEQGWEIKGLVKKRYRHGRWKTLRFKKVFWLWSKLNLYPGQRLPNGLRWSRVLGVLRSGRG